MFCPECGAQLEDGAIFCTQCGTKIESEDLSDVPATPDSANSQTIAYEGQADVLPLKETNVTQEIYPPEETLISPPLDFSPLDTAPSDFVSQDAIQSASLPKKRSRFLPLIIVGALLLLVVIALTFIFFVIPRLNKHVMPLGSDAGSAVGSMQIAKSNKKDIKSSSNKKNKQKSKKASKDKKTSDIPRVDASASQKTQGSKQAGESGEYNTLLNIYNEIGSLDQQISQVATDFNNNYLSDDMSYRYQLEQNAKTVQSAVLSLQTNFSAVVSSSDSFGIQAGTYRTLIGDLRGRIDVICLAWDAANRYGTGSDYYKDEILAVLRSVYDSSNRNKYKVEFDSLYPSSAPTPPVG